MSPGRVDRYNSARRRCTRIPIPRSLDDASEAPHSQMPGFGGVPLPGTSIGIDPQRVITETVPVTNLGTYRACAETGTKVRKTRPYRPQTNGKVERFHRILLEVKSDAADLRRRAPLGEGLFNPPPAGQSPKLHT